MRKLDWKTITKTQGVSMIEWRFNVSTGSWWGGFFERLIRSAKELIRRTLGKHQVNKKELEMCLTTVTYVLNGRPLTYLSEDPQDLEALTPSMFLHPYGLVAFPEGELISSDTLRFRYKYVQTLRSELQQRWRKEYLGLLVATRRTPTRTLVTGDLVVVSSDNKKRHEWDLGRIQELVPGKDGIARVARIKTKNGTYTRPIQRLHPLEMESHNPGVRLAKETVTRSGRKVIRPSSYN